MSERSKPPAVSASTGKEERALRAGRTQVQVEIARRLAVESARSLSDDKCEDVIVLDVVGLSQLSDFLVIASGTSDRQMRSAATNVKTVVHKIDDVPVRSSSDDRSTWIVVDCVDVIVHVFEPNTRAYYDLEMIWGDAPRVEWRRDGVAKERNGRTTRESGDDGHSA